MSAAWVVVDLWVGRFRSADAAAERTVEGLWHPRGLVADAFTPAECRNYFRHCG